MDKSPEIRVLFYKLLLKIFQRKFWRAFSLAVAEVCRKWVIRGSFVTL